MRIAFIAKRHPQQRDLIARPYGRFYHLPAALAARGHAVRVQLCGYRKLDSEQVERAGVQWSSHDFRRLGVLPLLRRVAAELEAFAPDWVVGCSDAWAGWLAARLARRCGARLAIDAYDNYEAYMPWNLPLHWGWRRAVRAADLVTAAGPQLAELLQRERRGGLRAAVLPMTADADFVERDRATCRAALGLPPDAPLLGYIGSWTQSRGTPLILDVLARVRARLPQARLVLSGRPPSAVLQVPGVVALGYLPDASMPLLVAALDVACIVLADTPFGRYSYPAKLCEAMACGVPVVASATDAARWMLADEAAHLAPLGDAEAFAQKVLAQLRQPRTAYPPTPSWQELGARLEQLLLDASGSAAGSR